VTAPEVSGRRTRRGGVVSCRALLFCDMQHFDPSVPQKHPRRSHPPTAFS